MQATGITVEQLYSRMPLLVTPSATVPMAETATIVPDQVLPDGRESTDGWSEIGTGLAEAHWQEQRSFQVKGTSLNMNIYIKKHFRNILYV